MHGITGGAARCGFGSEQILRPGIAGGSEGSAHDDALLEVYGFDTDGLDDLWRRSLELEPRTSTTFPHRGVASLAVLMTIAECMK